MLALRGIPAVYFHSLVATENDAAGVARTGRRGSINRRKFARSKWDERLSHAAGAPARVLDRYRTMLRVRRAVSAFHPDAPQRVIDSGDERVFAFVRGTGMGSVFVLANFSGDAAPLADGVPPAEGRDRLMDLLGGRRPHAPPLLLPPYGTVWLSGTGS